MILKNKDGEFYKKRKNNKGILYMKKIKIFIWAIVISSVLYAQKQNHIVIRTYKGTAEEIGKAFGKDEGKNFTQFYSEIMKVKGIGYWRELAIYYKIKSLIKMLDSETIAEMQAFSKVSKVPYRQIVLTNYFYDLISRNQGCRQSVAWGEKTKNKMLIHARNLDWNDWGKALRSYNILLTRYYKTGNAIATLGWPGFLGCLTGCNNKGLVIAYNQLSGGNGKKGVPIFLILRNVLRNANSLSAALEIIKKSNYCTNGSIMISSIKDNKAMVVDIMDDDVLVKYPQKNFIVNNNTHYFEDEKLLIKDYQACPLYKITKTNNDLTVQSFQNILSDKKVLLSCNILTAIFVMEQKKLYISCGRYQAAKGPYKEIDLFANKDTK